MGLKERETKRKNSLIAMFADVSDGPGKKEEPEVMDIPLTAQDINIVPRQKTETRSKRINLLTTPSLYAEAQKKCDKMGISLNECINQFLSNWVQS